MGDKTGISWTDATWNPIRGCSKVSDGCKYCYAESVANRFSGTGLAYEGLVHIAKNDGRALGWNGHIKFVEEHLLDPIRWKRPRKIFVNSMSDLFHENVTDEMRDRIFAVMALCPQHTFQILTKRPDRMREYLNKTHPDLVMDDMSDLAGKLDPSRKALRMTGEPVRDDNGRIYEYDALPPKWPLANLWLGVSVEDQQAADERIPLLLQTPAALRFLSCEPLLGPVDLEDGRGFLGGHTDPDCDRTEDDCRCECKPAVDWVIAGGESGRNARLMEPEWARSLRDQCAAAGVPFFFKQWGEWFRRGIKASDHLLDGVEHHAFPEVAA